jgi:hypothetical protein
MYAMTPWRKKLLPRVDFSWFLWDPHFLTSTGCLFLRVGVTFKAYVDNIQKEFCSQSKFAGVLLRLRSTLVLITYLSPSHQKNTQIYKYTEDKFKLIYTRCSSFKNSRYICSGIRKFQYTEQNTHNPAFSNLQVSRRGNVHSTVISRTQLIEGPRRKRASQREPPGAENAQVSTDFENGEISEH